MSLLIKHGFLCCFHLHDWAVNAICLMVCTYVSINEACHDIGPCAISSSIVEIGGEMVCLLSLFLMKHNMKAFAIFYIVVTGWKMRWNNLHVCLYNMEQFAICCIVVTGWKMRWNDLYFCLYNMVQFAICCIMVTGWKMRCNMVCTSVSVFNEAHCHMEQCSVSSYIVVTGWKMNGLYSSLYF